MATSLQASQSQAAHLQRSNSLFNSAAFSQLLNAHNLRGQSPYLSHLQQPARNQNPYGPMSPYSHLAGGHQPPSLISGHGIPTSLAHMPQSSPMIRPSPPPMSNSSPMNPANGPPKIPTNLPITSAPGHIDFNQSLSVSAAHQLQQQQQALNNQAAAAAALGLPYEQPRKKMHPSPSQPSAHQNQSSQLPSTAMNNPYLSYAGLPPGLAGGTGPGAGQLPANLFAGQNLTRTPPPNISSLINSAAFSHLFNTHH